MAYPILAASNTWYKSTQTRSTITQINIVDSYTPTGSENETWNADTGNTGSIKCYRTGTILTIAGNGSGKIAANANSSYLFSYAIKSLTEAQFNNLFKNVTTITGLDLIDTSNVTTLQQAFGYCLSLTSADLSSWNTSNVENLRFLFGAVEQIGEMSITSINVSGWNVSKVTTFVSAFQYCTQLTTLDLSSWVGTSVLDASNMFSVCSKLTSINAPKLILSNATNMQRMFYLCTLLTNLDMSNWDVSNVTSMYRTFEGCKSITSLDVSKWDTSNVTTMEHMFAGCSSLITLDVSNWNVSNVTIMRNMFYCGENYGTNKMSYAELNISNWDTSSCTDMSFMFYGCDSPAEIDVSKWDVSKVTTFDHMFAHSYIKIGDVRNWTTPAATNMNAMFYSVQNEVIDVSNLDTSNVTSFAQMFEASAVQEIIGLENFNTINGIDFQQMFQDCTYLKTLNLGNFNTKNAKDGMTTSANDSVSATLYNMFTNTPRLEELTVGPNFSINGDGTTTNSTHYAILPTPNSTYITDADGYWYSLNTTQIAPNAMPTLTANTYYASLSLARSAEVSVKNSVILDTIAQIKQKTGKTDRIKPSNMPLEIAGINGGSGGLTCVEEKDVNFYDYDGTLLYSYTLDEVQGLTELPPAPTWHDELVFYGWNWTLATLKTENCPIDVGALYDTNDSKAHMHITIDEFANRTVSITLHAIGSTTTAYIDWGDGSVETISVSTTPSAFSHTYSNHGNYVIKVHGDSMVYLGYYSGSSNIFGDSTVYSPSCTLLRKVFFGTKCGAGRYAFAYCSALEYATLNPKWGVVYGLFAQSDNLFCCHIPMQGNAYGYYVFQACNSLRTVAVSENTSYIQTGFFRDCASLRRIRPKKSTNISEGYNCYQAYTIQEMRGKLGSGNTAAFQSCYCLRKFDIYETSTAIPQACFNNCYVLQSLDIPASVTSIGAQAFQNCYGMRRIRFNSTTPPTVANANAFTNIPTTCIFEVPVGSLATYQAATNYGTIAAQMVEV